MINADRSPKVVIKTEYARLVSFLLAASTFIIILSFSVVSYFPFLETAQVHIVYRYDRWLAVLSLAYFFLLLLFSAVNKEHYSFILPLVMLTVPNAVNSIFPSIMLGPLSDRTNASFPFVTHIDIFLVVGVILYVRSPHKVTPFYRLCIFISVLMLVFLSGVVYKIWVGDNVARYLNNAFHIRYLALLYLLHPLFVHQGNRIAFIKGVVWSVPLLLIEAGTSTFISGGSFFGSFSSGNFANNNFGHLLAFMFVLIAGFWRSSDRGFLIGCALACLLLGVAATGVRGAYLALFLTFTTVLVCRTKSLAKTFIVTSVLVGLGSVVILSIIDLDYWVRFFDGVIYIVRNGFDAEKLFIDPMVTSIFTRITLWSGTVQMFLDHPFFGVGFANWNLLKSEFSIPYRLLLDPHNEVLFFLSSYGAFVGLGYLLCVHFYPAFYTLRSLAAGSHFNPYLFSLICFFFSGFTNSNSSKHQFFALITSVLLIGLVHASCLLRPRLCREPKS